MALIFFSSLTLLISTPLDDPSTLKTKILEYVDLVVTGVFACEMALKVREALDVIYSHHIALSETVGRWAMSTSTRENVVYSKVRLVSSHRRCDNEVLQNDNTNSAPRWFRYVVR